MAENAKEFNAKFKEDMAKMKQLTPNMLAGFGGLFQKVMQDGKLSLKIKELIAVSIAVALSEITGEPLTLDTMDYEWWAAWWKERDAPPAGRSKPTTVW